MKIKMVLLLVFLFAVFSIDKINAKKEFTLLGKIIVVDSGHDCIVNSKYIKNYLC